MGQLAAACKQHGKACTFFKLELVEYNQSQCFLLAGNQQEIKIVIQGQRPPNHSSIQDYELEVHETGGHSLAEFARKSDPLQTFFLGTNKQSGSLDTAGYIEIIFLVRKAQKAPSGQKIVVRCTFGHGFPDRWCTDRNHQASIVLTVV